MAHIKKQIARGTAAQVAAYTGLVAELVMDTTNKALYLNDGTTQGGIRIGPGMVYTGTSPINISGSTISLGVVPVANGGTGSSIQNFVDLSTAQTVAGNKSFTGTITAPTPASGTNNTVVATTAFVTATFDCGEL